MAEDMICIYVISYISPLPFHAGNCTLVLHYVKWDLINQCQYDFPFTMYTTYDVSVTRRHCN